MRTHVSIMAHADAKDTFLRHFPYWKMQTESLDHIMAWMPEDGKFQIDGLTYQTIGKRQHHGPQALLRFRYMLEFLNGMDYERFLIYEYDSFSVSSFPADMGDFAANCFIDPNAKEQGFEGSMFCHPPLVFSKTGLSTILKHLHGYEKGFWDRAIGLAVQKSGIQPFNLVEKRLGFSSNTIEPSQFQDLRFAILGGAICFHGVKTVECLEVIKRADKHRRMLDELHEEGLV